MAHDDEKVDKGREVPEPFCEMTGPMPVDPRRALGPEAAGAGPVLTSDFAGLKFKHLDVGEIRTHVPDRIVRLTPDTWQPVHTAERKGPEMKAVHVEPSRVRTSVGMIEWPAGVTMRLVRETRWSWVRFWYPLVLAWISGVCVGVWLML